MLSDGIHLVSGSTYVLLPAAFRSRDCKGKVPIVPDTITFDLPLGYQIQDYSEVVFVDHGGHVFHGHVTNQTETSGVLRCEAKSVEWLLAYRYIPPYIFASGSTVTEVFEDSSTPFVTSGVPAFGLWYLIQSNIPNGAWTAYNTTVSQLSGGGINSVLHGKTKRCSNIYPDYATDETGAATLSVASSLPAITENQYWETDSTLYVMFGDGSYGPNAHLTCADWWLDCKIRSNVSDSRTITKDLILHGQAKKKLDEFIEGLGMEPQFLPASDGYVYFDLADEISRGSVSDPLRIFQDGKNCQVKIAGKINPSVQVVVGILDDVGATTAATDWDARAIQLVCSVEGSGDIKPAVTARINALIDDNQPAIEITFPGYDFFLRIGDYVRVTSTDTGTHNLRISSIRNHDGITSLHVGKKPFSPSKAFGDLTRPTVDPDLDLISSKEISGGNFETTTGTFVVKATKYAAAGVAWRCVYKEEFGQAIDDSDLSTSAFITVSVNSKIVPPGRIKLNGTSIEVDLTDYCTVSAVSNQTNSISRTIYNYTGYAAGDDAATVNQYCGKAFI